jgi:predicted ATPase/class 3 adenylate cyclase
MPENPQAMKRSTTSDALVSRAFLFTDVEGSSRLMEQNETACKEALARHDELLRGIAAERGGHELAEAGDGFLFVFEQPESALEAGLELQRQIEATHWGIGVERLRVRVALGWGDVTPIEQGEYRGLTLNRTARLLGATHGGQIVCGRPFIEAVGTLFTFHELGWFHLRDLAEPEQVFQVQADKAPRQMFPPLRAVPVVPCNLPRTFTRFFGREAETAKVCELLRCGLAPSGGPRIVTLTGLGGTGKTRLSLAIAEQLRGEFAEAAWFVPLADVSDPALIPLAIRDALSLPTGSANEPLEQVTKFLAARPGLLVLDNFEQLLPAGGDVLSAIATNAPELRWLVSSRQRLGLAGEIEFPVSPLDIPSLEADDDSLMRAPSVQLFADRAQAVRPSFELSSENAVIVAELCRRLEGVPLAIELAASRAGVVAPAEMLQELTERLDFCESTNSELPVRHRSLRAAIDWSYDFLPPALGLFFESLSVFRGGWNVDAATTVAHTPEVAARAGETRRALAELRAASLVGGEETNGTMRFYMLETIRQYAAEKLASRVESDGVRLRHASFFSDLAERAEAEAFGAKADLWTSRLDTERENLRAALAEASKAPTFLAQLATSLAPFWIARGLVSEGRRWLSQCEGNGGAFPPKTRATVLYCSGTLAVQQGDWPSARSSFLAALSEFRALHDEQNVAALLTNLGIVSANNGELREARRYFVESLEQYARLQHPTREALALMNLGTVCTDLDDMTAAGEAYERMLKLCETTGDDGALALALHGLAQIDFHAGNISESAIRVDQSLALNQKLRLQPRLAQNALLLACISAEKGEITAAASWLGAADWLTRDTDALASLRLNSAVEEVRKRLRGEISAEILRQETAAGRRMARLWCGDAG